VLVGRFGARSRVKPGEQVTAVVDTRALHFFDPENGMGIYDSTNTSKGAPS
jgi:multiple sugar transport system ATP-binding protein